MTDIPKYEHELSEVQFAVLEAARERRAICDLQDDVTEQQALEIAMQTADSVFEALTNDK